MQIKNLSEIIFSYNMQHTNQSINQSINQSTPKNVYKQYISQANWICTEDIQNSNKPVHSPLEEFQCAESMWIVLHIEHEVQSIQQCPGLHE